MTDNQNFDELTAEQIASNAAQVSFKMHRCAIDGGEVTFTQNDIKSLMKMASGQLFAKQSLPLDDFPDVIGGDKTEPAKPANDFRIEDYQLEPSGNYKNEFRFVIGEAVHIDDAMFNLETKMNILLRTKNLVFVGDIQYINGKPALPTVFSYFQETEKP